MKLMNPNMYCVTKNKETLYRFKYHIDTLQIKSTFNQGFPSNLEPTSLEI